MVINTPKILLIWPKTNDDLNFLPNFKNIFGQKSHTIPLPLLSVASSLGTDWKYHVLDEEIEPFNIRHVQNVNFVFISFSLPTQRASIERIINNCWMLKIPIIIGGSALALFNDNFSYHVIKVFGEIESIDLASGNMMKTVADSLSEDMKKGTLKPIYRAAGHPDVKTLPPPRYDLLDLKCYLSLSIQLSRGWRDDDEFPSLKNLHGSHCLKKPQQVIAELDRIFPDGSGKTVYIVDDLMVGKSFYGAEKQNLTDILLCMERWQREHEYPFDFFAKCSLLLSDHYDLLNLFAKIGINILFFPLEYLDIHIPVENLVKRIRTLAHYGMGVILYFPFGNSNDDDKSLQYRIELVEKSSVPVALIFAAQTPDDQTSKRIRHINKILYSPQSYFSRCLSWIEKWNDQHALPGKKGSIPENMSVTKWIKNLFIQGLLSGYRFAFIKYILLVLWKFRGNYNKLALGVYLSYIYKDFYIKAK